MIRHGLDEIIACLNDDHNFLTVAFFVSSLDPDRVHIPQLDFLHLIVLEELWSPIRRGIIFGEDQDDFRPRAGLRGQKTWHTKPHLSQFCWIVGIEYFQNVPTRRIVQRKMVISICVSAPSPLEGAIAALTVRTISPALHTPHNQ